MKQVKKQLSQDKRVELHPEENESSSSEDDEDAECLTEEVEEGFFKVLSRLKKKDSKLYDGAVRYYPTNDSEQGTSSKKEDRLAKLGYKHWLKGEIKKVEDGELKEDLEALHSFWANPKISKEDQFLRDYILNKKFLEPDDKFDVEKELEKLSEEEKEIDEQVTFEQKYNCRFENPDNEYLKKYPQISVKNNEETSESYDTRTKGKKKKTTLVPNIKKEKLANGWKILEKPEVKSHAGKKRMLKNNQIKTEVNCDVSLKNIPQISVKNNEDRNMSNDTRTKRKRKSREIGTHRKEDLNGWKILDKSELNSHPGKKVMLKSNQNIAEVNCNVSEFPLNDSVVKKTLSEHNKKEKGLKKRKPRHRSIKRLKMMSEGQQ